MSKITIAPENDIAKSTKDKLPLCLAPFIGLFHSFNISSPCCEFMNIDPVSYTKSKSPEEFLHSENLSRLRKSLMEYDYDSLPSTCKVCLNSPTSHSKFYTVVDHNHMIETYLAHKHKFDENGHIDKFPLAHLIIGISNKCNASCRMCFPMISSSKVKLLEDARIGSFTDRIDNDLKFKNTVASADIQQCIDLINNHKDTLREVVIQGGDPIQAEELPMILDTLLEYKNTIRINFLSNGTFDKLADGRLLWDILRQFNKADIIFSIDSIPEVNEYIRIGLKTKRILKLLLECEEYFKDLPHVSVGVHCTLSNYNIYYLPEFLDWIDEHIWHRKLWLNMNCVNRPIYQAPHNLPPELRLATLKKLREYKTDIPHFKSLIEIAKNALLRYPFSPSDWNTCLWLDKKQDVITKLSFPLFEPYKNSIIEVNNWDSENLHAKTLKD